MGTFNSRVVISILHIMLHPLPYLIIVDGTRFGRLSVCLVQPWRELILIELILVKSELNVN